SSFSALIDERSSLLWTLRQYYYGVFHDTPMRHSVAIKSIIHVFQHAGGRAPNVLAIIGHRIIFPPLSSPHDVMPLVILWVHEEGKRDFKSLRHFVRRNGESEARSNKGNHRKNPKAGSRLISIEITDHFHMGRVEPHFLLGL